MTNPFLKRKNKFLRILQTRTSFVAPPAAHGCSVFCEHLPTEAGVGHLLLTAVPLPRVTVKHSIFKPLYSLSGFLDKQMCGLPKKM